MPAPFVLATAPPAPAAAPAAVPDVLGAEADERHHWPLPHQEQSAHAARRSVRGALADWAVDGETVDSILLVVSELVTNSILHATPPLSLSLVRAAEELIRVEVHDGGCAPRPAPLVTDDDPQEHGRGLGIVAALAAACGTSRQSGGTICWAEFVAANTRLTRIP